jgi:hypothetical protein
MRRRRFGECKACHRSDRRCTVSQKSALLLSARASINAVSAVMARTHERIVRGTLHVPPTYRGMQAQHRAGQTVNT